MNMSNEEQFSSNQPLEQPQFDVASKTNGLTSRTEDVADVGNLDRVRDILFGSHMRNYEKRFSHLESRLVKEYADLRNDVKNRLDFLEDYTRKEVNLLTERLQQEKHERHEQVEELAQDLEKTLKSLEKKIAQLDEQSAQRERHLRQSILELSKSFSDEMQQKSQDILALLQQEAQEIRKNKAERSTLVNLLTSMAMQLNQEIDS